jgi:hypothetical protein
MIGIVGAVAKGLDDTEYSADELGTDIAAGYHALKERQPSYLEEMLDNLGPEATAAFLSAILGDS